jgi:Mn2+/Fe2+ NRAMP family transporter
MIKTNYIKTLGPGLMWAAAAIGVSHLVQSTRAGASFGFELIWLIVIANLLKYPFFEFAPRYTASTGESLIDGYRRLGILAVIVYVVLTISTMFTIQSAVTAVTAGLFAHVFVDSFDSFSWAIIIICVSALIIAIGRYSLLDKFIKVIIIILTLSTIIAIFSASFKGFNPNPRFSKSFSWDTDIAFIIAFVGWMPSAIDISVWHSMWILAKKKATGYVPKLKEALFDFNIGYIGTSILSVIFLMLGAFVMYGTGETFSDKGTIFASQLINLYTESIGNWANIFIAIAALTTMFSTTITCLDAFPRVLSPSTEIIFPKLKFKTNILTWIWLLILIVGTLTILRYFAESLKTLVDIATTLSFMTAPILGYLNFKVVMGKNVPEDSKPKLWLKILTYIGLSFLTGFGIYFLIWRFI